MSRGENDDKKAVDSFMNAINGKINKSDGRTKDLFFKARIYKVPEDLRKLNKSAYTPRVIAIGPLHWKDKHLQKPMEHVKRYYTHQLLARLTSGIDDKVKKCEKIQEVLRKCVEKMKKKEYVEKAKKYYAAEIKMNDDQMSEMMLFDGCFILELLYSTHLVKTKEARRSTANGGDCGNSQASSSISQSQPINGGKEQANPILDCILTASIVKHDLLLLENQIPFFVLEDLFRLTVDQIPDDKIPGGKKLKLKDYVVLYFSNIMSPPDDKNSGSDIKTGDCSPNDTVLLVSGSCSTEKNEQVEKDQPGEAPDHYYHIPHDQPAEASDHYYRIPHDQPVEAPDHYFHILHLLHKHYLPRNQRENSTGGVKLSELEICASELEYAGVKFEPNFEGNSLFDVKFEEPTGLRWWLHRSTFKIPILNVHDPTEPFFRNLIALEQCCPQVSRHFTSYAKLVDMLINSEKDVQVLKKAKILHNYLGTDEDVSDLFNKLCMEVVLPEFYFKEACQKASKYSDFWWPQFMAYLRRRFFPSPWKFIGFCLALIFFLIQIISSVHDFFT